MKDFLICYECGAQMPADTYARTFGRCARHADEEKTTPTPTETPRSDAQTFDIEIIDDEESDGP